MSIVETLHKYHAAYVWLETNGYNPIGVYGKYVIVTVNGQDTIYKNFCIAAESLGWTCRKSGVGGRR